MANEAVDQCSESLLSVDGSERSETSLFSLLFPEKPGRQLFNSDDHKFLSDMLFALIAADLSVDEIMDNIEALIKQLAEENLLQSSEQLITDDSSELTNILEEDQSKDGVLYTTSISHCEILPYKLRKFRAFFTANLCLGIWRLFLEQIFAELLAQIFQ